MDEPLQRPISEDGEDVGWFGAGWTCKSVCRWGSFGLEGLLCMTGHGRRATDPSEISMK